jgi:hypothetical protein
MVTAMATARMVITVAAAEAKTTAATAIAEGTNNNQLKVTAEEMVAAQWRW